MKPLHVKDSLPGERPVTPQYVKRRKKLFLTMNRNTPSHP